MNKIYDIMTRKYGSHTNRSVLKRAARLAPWVFLALSVGLGTGCAYQKDNRRNLIEPTIRPSANTQPAILNGLEYKTLNDEEMRDTNQGKNTPGYDTLMLQMKRSAINHSR